MAAMADEPIDRDVPLLSVQNLSKSYDGKIFALSDMSFEVSEGQLVSVIGSSGAGKSTLLRCIDRLIKPTSGNIEFEGVDMTFLSGRKLRRIRRNISMVFQNYNLILRSSVIDNVLQGRLGYMNSLAGTLGLYSRADKEKAIAMLKRVDIEKFAYVRADQLSGGQKQRVGIARALVQEPKLILADEPIASLDPASSRKVMEILRSAVREFGIACLVSLHQVEYALEFSDYIIGISKGKKCCQGTPAQFTDDILTQVYTDEEKPDD